MEAVSAKNVWKSASRCAVARPQSGKLFTPLGDPAEASIAKALDFLSTGAAACTPISGGKDGSVAQRENLREMLQPAQPNAAQHEIPGLY